MLIGGRGGGLNVFIGTSWGAKYKMTTDGIIAVSFGVKIRHELFASKFPTQLKQAPGCKQCHAYHEHCLSKCVTEI